MSKRKLEDSVKQLEYELAMQKAVLEFFPDAKVHRYNTYGYRINHPGHTEFQDKSVNKVYTKFEFERRPYGVWVSPYCEVQFEHEGKTEMAKIHSAPKSNRLVYLSWNRTLSDYVIKFSRITFNFKNNEFKEDMLSSCRAEIMSFVKNNGKYKMDDKHLEPRLKKLLVFT